MLKPRLPGLPLATYLRAFAAGIHEVSRYVSKSVFRVSDKTSLKPVSSAHRLARKLKFHLYQVKVSYFPKKQITKVLTSLPRRAGWSAPLLFANTEDRFSHFEAQVWM